MSKAQRIEIYEAILKEEGFKPSLNRHGNLRFKFEGLFYTVELDEGDEDFFRMTHRSFSKITNASDHLGSLIGALHATAETKVAKVCVFDGEVVAAIELFMGSPEHFRPIILRSLNALKSAVNRFMEFPPENYTSIF